MDKIMTKAHTHIQVENYTMVWKLYNFNKLPFLSDDPIYGPKFTLGSETKGKWTIMMSKENIDDEESIGFRLTKETVNKNICWEAVKFSVTIKSKDGLSQICVTDIVTNGSMDHAYQYIKLRNLSPENKQIFKSVDLTVECSMEYMYHKEQGKVQEPYPEDQLIVEDMKRLHVSKAHSDIMLVVKDDDTEFACHKSILCTRSYRFNMECQDLEDNSRLVLNLEKETAKALIWYIYTSEMPHKFSEKDYQKLCRAAAHYHISHLLKICQDFLNAKGSIFCMCPKCKDETVDSDDLSSDDDISEDDA